MMLLLNRYITNRGRSTAHADLFREIQLEIRQLEDLGVQVQFWLVGQEQNAAATHLAKAALRGQSARDAVKEYFAGGWSW